MAEELIMTLNFGTFMWKINPGPLPAWPMWEVSDRDQKTRDLSTAYPRPLTRT